jgi:hypothetical protein
MVSHNFAIVNLGVAVGWGVPEVSMRWLPSVVAAILLAGCVVHLDLAADKPLPRAVHAAERTKVGYFYSLKPTCEVDVLPEISIIKAPAHGSVYFETGQDYPNYSSANIRSNCNKQLAPDTQLFYQSIADFQGTDSFVVNVRYANSHLRTITYNVTVR